MEQIFYPADILLPDGQIDLTRWAVIACDQYTSQPEYWQEVEEIVGEAPSTLRLTLPEVYLGSDQEEARLEDIRRQMKGYLQEGILRTYPGAMIYLERTDSVGRIRAGIVCALDLMQYDFRKGTDSPVRATEKTIQERIPPRLRVRENGALELPHIMILMDDPEKEVMERLPDCKDEMEVVYDFDLMKKGGHLKGWLMKEEQVDRIQAGLDALGEGPLLFAVGDGNHSLATAKVYYDQLREKCPDQDLSDHPARYALVELVNLHSPALEFEPIHRIVTHANINHLYARMTKELGLVRVNPRPHEVSASHPAAGSGDPGGDQSSRWSGPGNPGGDPPPGWSGPKERKGTKTKQCMTIVIKGQEEHVMITKPSSRLAVGSLQNFLDSYIAQQERVEDIRVDYIHGKEQLKALTWEADCMGFLMPGMEKAELFPAVIENGSLPRKTFSMGHAEDKRYYMESRRIIE